MQATEQTVQRKTSVVPYKFEQYPMDLYKPDGVTRRVNNKDEYEIALDDGFSENPPAIPASVAVAPMTTQPAIQSAYDALKKELEGKTAQFNLKYAQLEAKFQALEKTHAALVEKHEALSAPAEVAEPEAEPAENPFANMQPAEAPVSRLAAMFRKDKPKDA